MAVDCFVYIGGHGRDQQGVIEKMSTPTEGIAVFRFDTDEGTLEYLDTFGGLNSPSFLALHPNLPALYAIERHFDPTGDGQGAMAGFSIDERTGALEMTSRVESLGLSSPHVGVHPSGRHAYAGHWSGEVVSYPIDEAGRIGPADSVVHQKRIGSDLHGEESHAQQVRPSSDGRFLYVPDRALDTVFTYPTESDGTLADKASSGVDVPPGSGPRHLAWHPSERFAFTNGEMSSSVFVLAYNAAEGTFELLSEHSTLPSDFNGESSTAEVLCHRSGRAVYVSNRGHDSIAVFSFEASTGAIEFKGTQSTFGRSPRNFNIDPTGTFLIAANQAPGNLVVFRLNPETLWPEPTGVSVDVASPTCVVFRPIGK